MRKIFPVILWVISGAQANAQNDSLDLMIGQMIMVGIGDFDRLEPNAPIYEDIRKGHVGGIIIFEKNLSTQSTSDNLREIIHFAQQISPTPLFVGIDEEGGRVNRLKPKYGFPKTKTAQMLGEMDNPDSTKYYAAQTAATLYSLGINMNFAPVVDVNINPKNPVIGSLGRSYSGDYQKVALHAAEFIDAHGLLGLTTVLKHFPGHGSSKNDTHLGIADVSGTWQLEELYPYKALMDSGKVKAIMTAHIVNRTLDSSMLPATLSDKIIHDLLRGFMGFDGVVISDDMQMGAISDEYGLKESIKKGILAGVDILLFANNVAKHMTVSVDEIHGIIRQMVETREISRERIEESYLRISRLKDTLGL